MVGPWPNPCRPGTDTIPIMQDRLGPDAEPLASLIQHESIEGVTPANLPRSYGSAASTLRRRSLVTNAINRDSIRLSFQDGASATAWLTVPPRQRVQPPPQARSVSYYAGSKASPSWRSPRLASHAPLQRPCYVLQEGQEVSPPLRSTGQALLQSHGIACA